LRLAFVHNLKLRLLPKPVKLQLDMRATKSNGQELGKKICVDPPAVQNNTSMITVEGAHSQMLQAGKDLLQWI